MEFQVLYLKLKLDHTEVVILVSGRRASSEVRFFLLGWLEEIVRIEIWKMSS